MIAARCRPLAAVLLALALVACRDAPRGHGAPAASSAIASTSAAPPAPPGPEELALISPIAQGSDLEGFQVREIHAVEGGVLRLVCVKDDATVRLDVALADEEGPVPPATAGKYAVFYTARRALPDDAARLARKLAKVLEAHQDLPPPKGMTKFVEKPKPGTRL